MNFKNQIVIIDSEEKLLAADAYYMSGDKPNFDLIALDTETTGLKIYHDTIIGFSLSPSPQEGIYVVCLKWVPNPASFKKRKKDGVDLEIYEEGCLECIWSGKQYPENVTFREYQPPEFIKAYLKRWTEQSRLLIHNACFDASMIFMNYGIDITPQIHCDTRLLKHFLDESTPTGLKETAQLWSKELGFDAEGEAKKEQAEMQGSVIKNGGKKGEVWRGDWQAVAIYGAKDTMLTYGLYEVGSKKLDEDYGAKGRELFYETEIMPVCREVVIPMRIGGVHIDVEHFETLKKELIAQINYFEDQAIAKMGKNLEGFSIGDSLEDISQRSILDKIIELEGLAYPTLTQKGVVKESLSKPAVKKAYESNPHWVWGYILGLDELKYSSQKMLDIKNELYREKAKRRYPFNCGSDAHLRWLLFDKLGNDKASVPQTDSATKDNPIPSCKAEVLEEFFLKKYDFIADVMMFRRLGDLLSNYVEKAVTLHYKGWLSMDLDQAGTTSGRFACRGGFNLQTLPQVENLSQCIKCESKKVLINKKGTLLANVKCTNCQHEEKDIICYSVIKEGFTAPEGMAIVNTDLDSAEPKCFSEVSNEPKLKEIFIKGYDFYSKIYCDVEQAYDKYSPDPKSEHFLKKVNPALRNFIKPLILSIPYGARGPQVANLMGFKKTIIDYKTKQPKEVTDVQKGVEWIEKYLGAYPELQKYMDKAELDASTKGWVETKMGRRRHFKYAPIIQTVLNHRGVTKDSFLDCKRKTLECATVDLGKGLTEEDLKWLADKLGMFYSNIKENGYWRYIKSLYKNDLDAAKNMPIQGLAGHICNKGMLETARHFKATGVHGYVALMVHDEVSCYVRKDQAEFAADLLKLGLEKNSFTAQIEVPITTSPVVCFSLKESK